MKDRLLNHIRQSAAFNKLISFLKKVRWSRRNINLYEVIVVLLKKLQEDELIERAYGVAFNLTLSVFPGLIFLFALIPYLDPVIPNLEAEIFELLRDLLPQSIYEAADTTIHDIIFEERGGLLTFGGLLSLYLATNGMLSLMKAFNRCYRTRETRPFLRTRLVATILTVILAFVLFFSVGVLIVGQILLNYVDDWKVIQDVTILFIVMLRFLVVFTLFLFAISFIYYLAPTVHDRWSFFSWGSILSTLLCVAISFGFSYYISNFGAYNKLYGSIGTLIAVMVWIFMVSVILLFGFEVNASIDKATQMRLYYQKSSAKR
ncbi:YihY/virulence factor BrkB family protein [Roseivirga sp. BDSF3-8]|uniref:YihY/virulence factor BrkB family protein n=1 Tax=Roseivirga sp. BDSF3-8 TaxID=3241598 RepID=UPI003531D813